MYLPNGIQDFPILTLIENFKNNFPTNNRIAISDLNLNRLQLNEIKPYLSGFGRIIEYS